MPDVYPLLCYVSVLRSVSERYVYIFDGARESLPPNCVFSLFGGGGLREMARIALNSAGFTWGAPARRRFKGETMWILYYRNF